MSMPMERIIKDGERAEGQGSNSASSLITCHSSLTDEQILTDSGFYWREREGVKVLVCRSLEGAGFANGFSTRLGGVSSFGSVPPAVADREVGNDLNLAGFYDDAAENIAENRRRFLAVFPGDMQLATVWQVHGDVIRTVASVADVANSEVRADALISRLNNVLVGVKTADCVPVLIGDPKMGAFAAIHAGWRGTVQSIVRKVVLRLAETYGSKPRDLLCAIGPAASGRNYEIGRDVIDAFEANFPTSEKYFTSTRAGHALIDLRLANRDQLTDSGVEFDNIYIAPLCTMERPDLFFSYRLEKQTYGKTGRLLSVIGRRAI